MSYPDPYIGDYPHPYIGDYPRIGDYPMYPYSPVGDVPYKVIKPSVIDVWSQQEVARLNIEIIRLRKALDEQTRLARRWRNRADRKRKLAQRAELVRARIRMVRELTETNHTDGSACSMPARMWKAGYITGLVSAERIARDTMNKSFDRKEWGLDDE